MPSRVAKRPALSSQSLRVLLCATLLSTLSACARQPAAAVAPRPLATTPPPADVAPPAPPAPRPELPLGGREIFPSYRLVGFCGTPGAPALGQLAGDLPARAKMIQGYAEKYARDRKAMLVFELIAVVVQGIPGPDGKYRNRVPDAVIDNYLQAARSAKALLLLNIQPGQSDFMTEVKRLEKYLRQPDVGLALDPEWAMRPQQTPGVSYGQTTGETLTRIAAYLSTLVNEGDLPEKVLVFHQVATAVLRGESALKPAPGVVVIKSVDGLGPKHAKIDTYNLLSKKITPGVHTGFKLFFGEDVSKGGRLMTPDEVMELRPEPEYVMYE